jgi:ubiquitin-like protein Pup
MAQEHKQKQQAKTEAPEVEETEAKDLVDEELASDVDDILNDIDDVLEINAAEFVQAYVQKGGQ